LPDEESGDFTDAVVVKRRWPFFEDFREENCVEFEVELESPVPNGHVADSTMWPSQTWSKWHAELKANFERKCQMEKTHDRKAEEAEQTAEAAGETPLLVSPD
jgi:hypothetical protein